LWEETTVSIRNYFQSLQQKTVFYGEIAIDLDVQSDMTPEYEGSAILKDIDVSLAKYSSHIVSLLLKDLKFEITDLTRILDFGAGSGTLARLFDDRTGIKPICVELDEGLTNSLKGEGFQVFQTLDAIDLDSLDFIYTSNVLEHIEFDEDIMRILASKLKSGGMIAIYVPAFPILFSNLDRNVGHYRRYTRVELVQKLSNSGFQEIRCNFNDSLGFFATFLLKLIRFKFNSGGEATLLMKIYDYFLFPISKVFDVLGCRYFLGKNLVASAKVSK
jgi:SAM-dependent methyltransferase